ncbi:MCE family protein [Mycobacterium sp. DL99]|uniref:MCE family protein n=1 Tax=Mycobacterium sp. DL99 TaxID=2528957 RepID=UPI0010810677|nr:MCE family protein [Mycobacterium sp. DL99]
MSKPTPRFTLATTLVVVLIGGILYASNVFHTVQRIHLTAYFVNTTGLYPGDQVRIQGVPVGEIDSITAGPNHVEVKLWYDAQYPVPADAGAALLSPALVSARVIQLTPPYTDGAVMANNAVIPLDRTAVPLEWDDMRAQLQKLTDSLQPTQPGGVSPLGSFINTGADNLRGQGVAVRDALTKLSQATSALGDHSGDVFGTVRHLSLLVAALRSSRDVLGQLNTNFAAVTSLLSNDPNEVGNAVTALDSAIHDVSAFVANNRDTLGTSVDKLAAVTTSINESLGDIKQLLHVLPNSLANFTNTYYPATGSVAAVNVLNQFANPLQFICGSIQAASRKNYEQSAKLCAQYMAPIFKNRQYNFPPFGTTASLANLPIPIPLPSAIPIPFPPYLLPILTATAVTVPIPVAGAMARPNEITYSEDRLRPDYVPPHPATDLAAVPEGTTAQDTANSAPSTHASYPGEVTTNADEGLAGMMSPGGGR